MSHREKKGMKFNVEFLHKLCLNVEISLLASKCDKPLLLKQRPVSSVCQPFHLPRILGKYLLCEYVDNKSQFYSFRQPCDIGCQHLQHRFKQMSRKFQKYSLPTALIRNSRSTNDGEKKYLDASIFFLYL